MKKLLLSLLLLPLYFQTQAQCASNLIINGNACDSSCTGVISLLLYGGIPPYIIVMEINGALASTDTATSTWQTGNLCAGDWISLHIYDSLGDTCTGPPIIQLVSAPTPEVVVTSNNATCPTCNDGTATITSMTGGTPPYNYQWSNGAIGQSITNLIPGVYSIWATDAMGCFDVDTFQIGVGLNGYHTISGQVYLDLNSNGIKDSSENGIGNLGVEIMPDNIYALTNTAGNYAFVVDTGTHNITFQGAFGWNLTSTPATYNVNVNAISVGNIDFGAYPDSTAGSACIALTSWFPRCFSDVPYNLTVHNNGFTMLSGTMSYTYDPLMTYVSSSIPPSSHVGNIITFTYSNVPPGQTFTVTNIFNLPAGGTPLSNQVVITGSDAFGYMFMETASLAHTVNCSCDPNDKGVQPAGVGVENYVAMDSWLNYLIRFQNTGNDTAFTVVVIDTLDAGLDLSSFILMDASHPVTVTTRPGNEFTFTFENIFLADSIVNEPASHGYLLYRIKGNSSNPDPTVINNTAYIYFDFNSAVVTNTTLITFSDNFLSIADNGEANEIFELFPNPTNDYTVLRLKIPSSISYSVTILDINGRKVTETTTLKNGSMVINSNNFTPGTYFIEATPSDNSKPFHLRMVKK